MSPSSLVQGPSHLSAPQGTSSFLASRLPGMLFPVFLESGSFSTLWDLVKCSLHKVIFPDGSSQPLPLTILYRRTLLISFMDFYNL